MGCQEPKWEKDLMAPIEEFHRKTRYIHFGDIEKNYVKI
jgi:hypothetical protein